MNREILINYVEGLSNLENISDDKSIVSFLTNLDNCLVLDKLKNKLFYFIKLFAVKDCVVVYDDMIRINIPDVNNFSLEVTIKNSDFEYGNTKVSYKIKMDGDYVFSDGGTYELYEDGSCVHTSDIEEEVKHKNLYKNTMKKSEYFDGCGNQVFDEFYKSSTDWVMKAKRTNVFQSISFMNDINEVFKRVETSTSLEEFGYGKSNREYNNVKYLMASDVNVTMLEDIKEEDFVVISHGKFKREIPNCILGRAEIRQKYKNF